MTNKGAAHKVKKEYSTLAEFVFNTREKLGLSQSGLAKRCNLNEDVISGIESGIELFLANTIRQKLAKGLKVGLEDIKVYEKGEDFHLASEFSIEEIKQSILENEGNKGFKALCPVCGSVLITRIAKMYDLEDNLMLHPKARCSKCPFQIT